MHTAEPEERYRICSAGARKIAVVKSILKHPDGDPGHQTYADQLDELGASSALRFRGRQGQRTQGTVRPSAAASRPRSWCPKVANFSIDLPEAAVAVQVSGTFGSRQEGRNSSARILRPKADRGGAIFYSVVARGSLDASTPHTGSGLAEQGYGCIIRDADDLLGPAI